MIKLKASSQITILKAAQPYLKEKAFSVRKEVFVDEQKVSREEEFDEFEATSRHFVALTQEREAVGAARWRETSKGVKLERFAVKKEYRGMHIGSRLVEAVLEDIQTVLGLDQYLYLHAQLTAVPLYKKFGFVEEGDQFEECNILHYKMVKES